MTRDRIPASVVRRPPARARSGLLLLPVFFLLGSCATTSEARLRPLPPEITFAGQPVPLENDDTAERVWSWYNFFLSRPWAVELWLERSGTIFPYVDRELAARGMPRDLRYLAVAESALSPEATSPVGAAGIWQFMPATAALYGLRVGTYVDERYDFLLETRAALDYFADARRRLGGSWALVCASYDLGVSAVALRMAQQKSSDYWTMVFPSETDDYVPKIVAIKLIMEHASELGFPAPIPARTSERVELASGANPVYLADIALETGLSYRAIWLANPQFRKPFLPPGRYALYLPAPLPPSAAELSAYESLLPYEPGSYTVERGDTLGKIARSLGVSVDELSTFNELDPTKSLAVGTKLAFWRRVETSW